MADFRAAFTDGVTLQPWDDPTTGPVAYSRINPREEHPHKRHVGDVGTEIEITATVAGVAAPLDAALGGRLFTAVLVESAQALLPVITSPGGQSSVVRFTPDTAGHYTLRLIREGGGSITFHADVQ